MIRVTPYPQTQPWLTSKEFFNSQKKHQAFRLMLS
ncbi:hypothetical protein HMPREF0530_2463 [Lacticaseibacillus paracasei subsp. paracasei ATCC 25302 = DSM 5622 = JCM 8130]|uniref:Uncharacterized protein n=3 Tax=Lacticaseibacillus paracasei TaxID=1597 RepID=A0A806LGL7_LACPA|nr:hypothetical protein AF91_07190 [Lacticaseibacillus paracasei N1115]EEI67289.1 hypothetical protein HMPREF0530_2463 [Lacticaseibacillus paracasei subsp. paracasei ATCC 25302 = DSM 5622 = JCM 8130]EPC52892.1 hypothetical protein Lpp7_06585 [Lacticaseibacillus paracasei subsp. paracasei Lpp7]EPC77740.1 hypothetical protein Lpp71_00932 [Lacticaseibacillus paracasei subsp. paracasei Lpp71]MCT3334783.1 hypothetical protein [Lacticaseibacillus paracasei]